jgi:hypothetical protein
LPGLFDTSRERISLFRKGFFGGGNVSLPAPTGSLQLYEEAEGEVERGRSGSEATAEKAWAN